MPEQDEKGAQNPRNSLFVVGSEAVLVLVPFVVLAIALGQKGELGKLPYRAEWGVASPILIGLALVRFVTGVLQARSKIEGLAWERVLMMFSVIVVFGLVPSLLVLSLVILSGAPSVFLAVMQIALFCVSLFLFISLGWAGHYVLTEPAAPEHGVTDYELTVLRARSAGD